MFTQWALLLSLCLVNDTNNQIFEGLRLFVMRSDVKGLFPVKPLTFAHFCFQEYF